MAPVTILVTANELFLRRGGSDDWYAFWIDGSESRALRFGKKGESSRLTRPGAHSLQPVFLSPSRARHCTFWP